MRQEQNILRISLINVVKMQQKKWKFAKKLIPENSKNSNNHKFEDIQNKAEQFNQFFSNVGKVTCMKTQESLRNNENNIDHRVRTESTQSHPLFKPKPVSVDIVILTFKCLKGVGVSF